MNCEECQENLSVYLDGELDETLSMAVRTHLTLCMECAKLCEDFAVILDTCQTEPPSEIIPPNSHALWCRISNSIEGDVKPPAAEPPSSGWRFSFLQVGSAVLGIALISSLLTVVGIRNYFEPSGEDFTSRSAATQTTFEKILSKVGLADTPLEARMRRLKEQESAIGYWDKRVQAQRAKWDNKMRDAFDRNLNEINQTVNDYTMILQQNPDDDLSGEMLDSALNDKMNLLRDFSEL